MFVPVRGTRFEEFLTEQFDRNEPLVAIGRPREQLPELGASRDYFLDSEWEAAISDWMTRSQLVVMVVGRTWGVGWEFQRPQELDVEGELVLVFPPEPGFRRAARWNAFRSQCESSLPAGLRLRPGDVLGLRRRSRPGAVPGRWRERARSVFTKVAPPRNLAIQAARE